MPGALRRALRRPARTLLKFEPVSSVSRSPTRGSADRRSSVRRPVLGQVRASGTKTWTAADHKHAFTITREFDADVSPDPFFVVHVSQSDGSYRRRTGRRFETFVAAVHRCSIYTREARRQVAYSY